jgi:glucose-6-phosphate isomerase
MAIKIKNLKVKTKNNILKLKTIKPEIRYLKEMREVLYDKKWAKKASNFEVYYMYRGVKEKNGLRYDITVIPPRRLGREFPKTKGHQHIKKYPELFIVLEGKALFLMQKINPSFKDVVEDVYVVEAKKNKAVIAPPFYAHITINPTKRTLKVANWLSKKCQNLYDLFEKNQGACYFALAQKSKIKWVKNNHYQKVPKLRFEKPLKKIPKNLDFLKK